MGQLQGRGPRAGRHACRRLGAGRGQAHQSSTVTRSEAAMERVSAARIRAYEESRFEVEGPTGRVTFTVGHSPQGDLSFLRQRPLAVVTAYNPAMDTLTNAQNRQANARLLAL